MKSILQTPEWVGLKVSQGWKSYQMEGIFVLEKPLPLGFNFGYSPEVEWNKEKIEKICEKLKENQKNSKTLFYRLEILNKIDNDIVQNLTKLGFIKAFEELQPEWRQIIDISKSEEDILNQMKSKGRYNIRVAQKHGVKVEVIPLEKLNEGLDEFYRLYSETGKYQKISLRGKKYFRELLEKLYPKNEAVIVTARYNSVANASLIITFFDGVASYLYGGTSRDNKQVMAPYLAHYEAIREAKKRNCGKYDLLAVSPKVRDQKLETRKNHKYDNLTRFKEQFGGEKVQIVGGYDLIFKPVLYKMFKIVEKYRRK